MTIHSEDLSTFIVPPRCQGQIVEYAYATAPDTLVLRVTDRSDRSVTYHAIDLEDVQGDIEPWNDEPSYDVDDMQPVSIEGLS